ncbi:MAG: pantoate--beta-alanine ligase [Ktedonobacterales bacterium]
MRVIETLDELVAARRVWQGKTIGLTPTMGYLHAGHRSLAQRARAGNEIAVASIFVNPTQFGIGEDLTRYPRDLPRDLALLEGAGVDAVFAPQAAAIYPPGFATYVEPTGPLAERLEAATRPGHFRGVATVVLKLFQLVGPTRAYFGQKDAQQLAVIRRMVADLNLPVEIVALPIVREADGLAMSSRNAYLNAEQRAAATALSRALAAGRAAFDATLHADQPGAESGDTAIQRIQAAMAQVVADEPLAMLDYAVVCDPATCESLTQAQAPALLAVAAKVGPARLIDNYLLRADGHWDEGVRVSAIA